MLTVRVIEASGLEQVREVRSVMLRPAKESPTGSPCLTYFLNHKDGEDWPNSIDVYDGTIYVMNENAKTVASYFLGNLPRTPDVGEGTEQVLKNTERKMANVESGKM